MQRVSISVQATSNPEGTAKFTRHASRFTLFDLDQMNDVGEYWCQVRLENNGTVLQEKSNILILYGEARYQGLHRCNGSGFVEQIDCLHTLQIIHSFITDDKPTNYEPSFSFNLFPTPITDGAIEKPEKSNKDLFAAIAVIVFFSILIVLLMIAILALLQHKWKTRNIQEEGSNQHEQPEIAAESLVTKNTAFTYQSNVAYDEVSKIVLNENKAYTSTTPLRPPTPPEYEYIH